ncbi:MAG TPA: transposase [Puia sp.]
MYKQFIGIDVSKLTFDVCIYGSTAHRKFANDQSGFQLFFQWIRKLSAPESMDNVLICFEHTGMYSLTLALYLEESQCVFAMISPLEIKRSLGIVRGKNDKVDARRIAEYAYEKREKITPTKLPSKAILQLHPLLTLRDRLARTRAGYVATRTEQKRFLVKQDLPDLFDVYNDLIACLTKQIKQLEKAIKDIIRKDDDIRNTFQLITAIKGVGFLVGTYLIVYTHNFTKFENWRKFACYAGVAPFDHTSGTSIRGKTQVSNLANKQMKKMLHLAALSASHTDIEMIAYYTRRVNDGKSKMCALNIIRNKLLARVFAVAKRGTAYVQFVEQAA